MSFANVLEYDPVDNWSLNGTTRWTEYDPVENWSICSSERWPEYLPRKSAPSIDVSTLDLNKIFQEVSRVSEISRKVDNFIENKESIFNLSASHILRNINVKTTRANEQVAHATLRRRQLERLNASRADVLKIFHISKSTVVEELAQVIYSYKNIYNLSIHWALHLAGKRATDKLLAIYLIDEAISLIK